jgi:hypothetical protein
VRGKTIGGRDTLIHLEMKFKRVDLLERLTANRENHINTYNESKEGYRLIVQRELAEALATMEGDSEHTLNFWVDLDSPPVCYSKDYDNAIEMLSMSVQDEVELDSNQFKKLVQDQWDWSDAFYTSASQNVAIGYRGLR